MQTIYRRDATGTYRMFSNPFGAVASGAPEAISGWTRVTADKLGRTVAVETFADGTAPADATSSSPNSTGKTVTGYSENVVTVTDQAGKARAMTQNALGQLVQVDAGGLSTFYKYTVAGDLTDVCQNGQSSLWTTSGTCQAAAQHLAQSRSFAYTSLGRLKSATNPESGTLTYTYDANGNVLTKADQRPMTVTWTYDGQNRPVTKSYSSDPGGSGTVYWCYDGVTAGNCAGAASGSYLKGRLTMVKNSIATNVYGPYDALGRVTTSSVSVPSAANPYSFTYQYNLADGLVRQSYPSGKVVSWEYDGAGRVNRMHQCEPGSSDGASQYVNVSQYSSAGQIVGAVRGPDAMGLTETAAWNTRQQMSSYAVKSGAVTLMNLGFGYCNTAGVDVCTENNGNLLRQTIGRNTGQTNAFGETQTYGYDSLNRIVSAGASGWSESYGHDEFGNTWWSGRTGLGASDVSKPSSVSWFSGNQNRAIDSGNPGQYGFDVAGNATVLSGSAITYDADGHQLTYVKPGQNGSYAYDGEGRRVKGTVNGVASTYVHDAAGELAAEYGGTAAAQSGVAYVFGDHLGSTRLTVDDRGGVTAFDYLPYGEPLTAGRTVTQGFPVSTDWLKVKFTGKERDSESGLDYFGARYFSGAQGRFTSPDPKTFPHDLTDPQSWNKYGYTRNNPLRYTDPDGEDWKDAVAGFLNGVHSSYTYGATRSTGNGDFRAGQRFGAKIAQGLGLIEASVGGVTTLGGGVACGTGVGCAAGAPAIAGGIVVTAHGASVALSAQNIYNQASGDAPQSSDSGSNEQDARPEYENPGHHDPKSPNYMGKRKDTLASDAENVYGTSVKNPNGNEYYGLSNGKYYRFSSSNDGKAHFSGYVDPQKVPMEIRKELGGPVR